MSTCAEEADNMHIQEALSPVSLFVLLFSFSFPLFNFDYSWACVYIES